MGASVECALEHKLIISNFSYFKVNNHLKSQLISSDSVDQQDIISHLDFGIISDTCFSIFVRLETLAKCQFKIIYRLSLQDYDGNDYFMKIDDKIVYRLALNSWKTDIDLDYLKSNAKHLLRNDQLTIRCKIVVLKTNTNQSNLSNVDILKSETTKSEISEFNAKIRFLNLFVHNWTIDNFANFYAQEWKIEDLLKQSNTFGSNVNKKVQFHLVLHPNGNGVNCGHNVSVFLFNSSPEPVNVWVRWKMSIVDRNGMKCNTKGGQDEFKGIDDMWGHGDYISIANLQEHSNRLLHNGRLILNCEVQVIDYRIDELIEVIDVDEEQNITSESYLNAKPTVLESITHKWTIDNIERFYSGDWKTVGMDSNKFYSNNKLELHLSLYPSEGEDDHLSIYLFHSSAKNVENVENVENVRWIISIINAKGEKYYTRVGLNVWNIEKYINLSILHEKLHKGRLTLFCEIQIFAFEQTKNKDTPVSALSTSAQPQLTPESNFKIISLVHWWTIDNFTSFYSPEWTQDNLKIKSNQFYSNSNLDTNRLQFHLGLFPSGFEEKNKGYVSIYLYHCSAEMVNEFVRWRLSIVNEKEQQWNTKNMDTIFNGKEDSWGFGDYVKVANLKSLYNDKLTLKCEVQMIDKESREINVFEDVDPRTSESYFNAKPAVRDSIVHKWTIDKFGYFMKKCQDKNLEIASNKCRFSSNNQFEFVFRLKATESGHLSVDLISDLIPSENLQLCIALIDGQGEKRYNSYKRSTNSIEPILSCKIKKPITKILNPFLRLLHNDSLIVQCEVKWLENSTIKAPKNIQQQQNNPNPTIPITETSTKFVYHTHSWTINDFSSYRTFVQDKPACVEHFLECPKILNENILDSTNSTVQLYARLYPRKVSNSLQLSLCLDGIYHSRIVQPLMVRIKILSKKDNNSKDYQKKFKNIFSKQKFQIQVSYTKIHAEGDLVLEIKLYTFSNSDSTKITENRLNQFTLGASFSRPWKPKRVNNVSTLSSSVTTIPLVPYRFVWSIETREQYCEQFESPKYSPLEGEQLNIFLKFNRTDKSIHLCSEMRYENKIYIWVHMSILDRNQSIFYTKDGFSTFKNGSSEWIFLGLLDDWISPNQLENGYLKIECELNLINEKTEYTISATRNQIHKDLNSLLVNEPQTDVEFHFGTDRKLYAHSGILQFRSRVFEDLFNYQKDDKQIDIDFSDVDTFEAMLQFVYTEEFVQIIDCADRLLPLADKFNLDSLKAICENMLIAKLKAKSEHSIMQSPELLLLANRHKANRLKDMAMEIINENKAPIRGTSAWQAIKTDPDLIEELFLYDSKEESLKRKRTNSNSS